VIDLYWKLSYSIFFFFLKKNKLLSKSRIRKHNYSVDNIILTNKIKTISEGQVQISESHKVSEIPTVISNTILQPNTKNDQTSFPS
jgi:hypothetical protein